MDHLSYLDPPPAESPADDTDADADADVNADADALHRPRRTAPASAPGVVSLATAIAGAVLTTVAVATASSGSPGPGTVLAWFAISVTAVAFFVGVGAVVSRRGSRWGWTGAVLALMANPLVLLTVLRTASGA